MTDGTELGRALRACRGAALMLVGISAAINLLGLAAPIYVMQLYDRVVTSRSIDTLVMLTLAVVGATGVLAMLDGLRNQILARIGIWLDDRLAPPVIAARLRLAATARTARDSEPLRDLAAIRGFLASPGIAPLLDAPWAPLFILILYILHPVLGAIGLVSAFVLVALAVLNEAATGTALRQGGGAVVRSNRLVEAACRNADAIRVMGMLDGLLRLWRREAREVRQFHLTASQRNALILAASRFTRLMVQSVIMGAAAWLVIDDGASPALLFASTFLLSKALAPVENAIATWRSLVGARAARRRLVALLQAAPEPRPGMPLPRPEGKVAVEQATYVPPGGDKPILRGVSLRFGPGEVVGVIGPSAAGKSTLARLIAGAAPPTSGQVSLDGAELSVWLAADGARHIGYLPQDVEIFCGTVRDNIARLADVDPDGVIAAAAAAGLHEMVMRLPQGYDTEIGEGGIKLSGGQRQRVALARALFGEPRLVVLDEPDAGLDQDGEAALLAALAGLKQKGTAVVIVSHRSGILNQVDKLAVMRHGVVELFGPREAVLAKLRPTALRPRQQIAARAATPA